MKSVAASKHPPDVSNSTARMMPLSHAVCLAQTDGPGGPAKPQPSASLLSPKRLLVDPVLCRANIRLIQTRTPAEWGHLASTRDIGKPSVQLFIAWRNERRRACMLWCSPSFASPPWRNVSAASFDSFYHTRTVCFPFHRFIFCANYKEIKNLLRIHNGVIRENHGIHPSTGKCPPTSCLRLVSDAFCCQRHARYSSNRYNRLEAQFACHLQAHLACNQWSASCIFI